MRRANHMDRSLKNTYIQVNGAITSVGLDRRIRQRSKNLIHRLARTLGASVQPGIEGFIIRRFKRVFRPVPKHVPKVGSGFHKLSDFARNP